MKHNNNYSLLFYCKYYFFLIFTILNLRLLSLIYIYNVKISYSNFLTIPVSFIVETISVSFLIYLGFKLNNYKVNLITTLCAVSISSSIFVLQYFTEFIWLFFFQSHLEPFYLQNFSSFSLYQLYHPSDILPYLVYPLQTISLWEVFYIVLIIYFIKLLSKIDEKQLGKSILITYILGNLSWIVFVTFINVINKTS